MSIADQYKSRTSLRMRMISQLEEWKMCKDNPLGEDGKPAPLRALVLLAQGLNDPLDSWPIDAKTDHVVAADKIIRKAYDWCNEMSNGQDLCCDLNPFFGTDINLGQKHFGFRVKPDQKYVGGELPLIGDLSNPREQSAALVREAITLGRDMTSFTGATLRINEERTERIITSLEDQLKEARSYIKELEGGRRAVMLLEQDLADKKLQRDQLAREGEMKLQVMEMAGKKILGYIPLFTMKLDQYLMDKFGVANSGELSDEGKEHREMLEMMMSRISDKDTAVEVFRALKFNKSEQVKVFNYVTKLRLEGERKTMYEEAAGVTKGLGGAGGRIRPLSLPPANTARPRTATGTDGK